jgi:hypothetical protein
MEEAISTASLTSLPPDQNDPNVAELVYKGREFKNHNSPTVFGSPNPHQQNLLTFAGPLSSVNAQAIFWPTGLGKGFTITALIRIILARQSQATKKGNRIMVIVKDSVRAPWHTELSKYTEFTTEKIRDPNSTYEIKGREKAISSAIAKVVKIVSLDAFARQIMSLSPEAIREKYSCDMVIIDEVHFLRVSEEVSMVNLDKLKNTTEFESKIANLMIHKFFQSAEIGLKIIATATPMYNAPIELVSIMNFVLPPERRMTIPEFKAALDAGIPAVREYLQRLKGYVTYVSEKDTLSPVYDEGKTFMYEVDGKMVESTIKIVECPMLKEQEDVYLAVLASEKEEKAEKERGERGKDKRPGAFRSGIRQALSFAFINPNNHFNNSHKGFEYFYDPDNRLNSKDGFVYLNPPKRLTVKEKAQLESQTTGGKRRPNLEPIKFEFRYRNDLFAGCKPRDDNLTKFKPLDQDRLNVIRRMSARFARIIEIVHNEDEQMFPGEMEMAYYYNPYVKAGGGILLGMCFYEMGYDVFHGVKDDDATRVPNKPKFAYMTGDPGSTAARSRNIRTVANHPSNAFCDKIAIVIGSDTTSVGVSFTNARKIIHNGAVFNLPRQPEGRVNRTDSHRNFKETRQKFVRRYYMACTMSDGSQTADHKMWWDVQEKEASIVPVEKEIFVVSWNVGLHAGPLQERFKGLTTDFTRYHMHHASEEFKEIENDIRRAFQIKTHWTFGEFQTLMGYDHRPDTLCWTLRGMLDRRDIIIDRFGLMKVIREDNGIYFISNPVEVVDTIVPLTHSPIKHNLFEVPYCTGFRINAAIDFRAISTASLKESSGSDDESLKQDMAIWDNPDSEAGQKRMIRLEQALLGKIKNEDIRKFILKDLAVAWFVHHDYYFHYVDEMRPKGNEGAYQFNRHTIDGKKGTVLIRVAKKSDAEFRYATAQESITFIKMINKRWADRDESVANRNSTMKFTVLKLVSSDRQIRIRDDSNPKYKKNGEIDRRGAKGKMASLYEPTEIVEFLYQCKVENQDVDKTRSNATQIKSEMITELGQERVKSFNDAKTRFFHSWLGGMNKVSKDKLIDHLMTYVTENNLLILK